MKSSETINDDRLQKIADAVAALARGDFEARLTPSDRGDEVDAIIVGQNMLAEELQASFEALRGAQIELEQRVKDRTAELERTNDRLTIVVNELESRNREMASLSEMVDLLQTSLNPEEAYAAIGQLFQQLLPEWSAKLYEFNASRNLLETVAAWGEATDSEDMFAPEDCRALRSGRVYRVEDTYMGLVCPHVGRKAKTERDSVSLPAGYMCVPLMAQGETIGTLYLTPLRQPEQLPAKQELVTAISEHIALAVANLKLRETLKRQSIRDPLTGLFNRRYMEESFERELARAVRKQHTVGIIMFDIDYFKDFNDTHGHDAGDAVLREVGALVLQRFRNEDIACRYGGEEFTLILPEASQEDARRRAESLREEIKRVDVYHRGRLLDKVTLSLGVAIFPDKGNDTETLLRAADGALYRAKQEGRDRVIVA